MSKNLIPVTLTELSATQCLNLLRNINDIPHRISSRLLEISSARLRKQVFKHAL